MGGLYGHRNINDEHLKKWIIDWNPKEYVDSCLNYFKIQETEEINSFLTKQVETVKEIASNISVSDESYLFDELMKFMTEAMFYCYFRFDSSTAYCGNFYEVLIGFADESTKKKILKGYDYIEAGGISLEKDGERIGHIGMMSDLFWHTFYDQYIVENNGAIEHIRNNEKDITLQIWGENLFEGKDQFNELIERILFECNVTLELNFKRTRFESDSRLEGEAKRGILSLTDIKLEDTPLRYFNFANYTKIPRHKYLAYYQVLEFFFPRIVKEARFSRPSELLIVEYIINNTFTELDIIGWLQDKADKGNHFIEPVQNYPTLTPITNTDILNLISKRIYIVRCSLVHAKEAPKDVNFIPNLNDDVIEKELALIKFVAEKVLYKWSKVNEM